MTQSPKSMRVQIALFGRTNVGKSSFLNMIANQDVAITSEVPGTTTDVVEKSMELLPIGPVNFLDTGGIDDKSLLSEKRIERALKILDRADVAVLIVENDIWTDYEEDLINIFKKEKIKFIVAINKIDNNPPTNEYVSFIQKKSTRVLLCSCLKIIDRDKYVIDFKHLLLEILPEEFTSPLPLIRDLIPKNGTAILIIPIDKEAPKGRIILPQVQTIRDILDNDSISIMVKQSEYNQVLSSLKKKPDIVVCDSQVVDFMVENTPFDIPCTTFSILFSRYKGDLIEEVKGAAVFKNLKKGDKVLIAEACSHHPNEDDIGRVKIPRLLRQYTGFDNDIDVSSGRDYPKNISDYKVIIHCGGCMLTRTEKLIRIQKAKQAGVPITNYGIAISLFRGVLDRVLSPFEDAMNVFRK
ncbi:MAG: [FeFe] hydrogenase H-cluster maturation GTPase HydF [bacterium]